MSRPANLLCAALALGTASLAGAPAQAEPDQLIGSYEVSHLPTLGGAISAGNSITKQGTTAGFAYLSDNASMHATAWRDGEIDDLGTLGGPNSAVLWPGKNDRLIVGVTETAEDNPLDENWSCSAFFPGEPTKKTCVGFVVEAGEMRPLPTLGGHNGFATGVNDRGQVVGWAENTVHDSSCIAPQVLQFRAAIWGPGEGEITELPPLSGDSTSAATAINDHGQVVGISGDCANAVGGASARNAVLWDDGEVIDLGNLGGEDWHTPMAINNRGDVIGFSNPTGVGGGAFEPRAFRWTEAEGMVDLGTLPGDVESQALGLNARGKIVGVSCGAGGCRAVVWKHDVAVDLNTRLASGEEGRLTSANDVNNRGTITGTAVDPATDDTVAFEAIRIRGRAIDRG